MWLTSFLASLTTRVTSRLSEEIRFGKLVGFGVPQSHNVPDDVRSPRIAGFQCCHLTRRHGDSRFFKFVSPK
jgi:hypothetical protein